MTARLKADPAYAQKIEPIRIVKFKDLPSDVQTKLLNQGVSKDTVFSLDNRRLYAAKQAKVQVNLHWATQDEIAEFATTRRFSTEDGGLTL